MSKKFVLTTVGISVLQNAVPWDEGKWRKRLTDEANSQELPDDVFDKAKSLAEEALKILRQENVKANRRLSAELNGLYGLYDDQLSLAKGDSHYLITTDTVLGKQAADIICIFLREQGLTVDIYTPPRLSTADIASFSGGIKDLIVWCENVIPEYRKQYEIVFNLTGALQFFDQIDIGLDPTSTGSIKVRLRGLSFHHHLITHPQFSQHHSHFLDLLLREPGLAGCLDGHVHPQRHLCLLVGGEFGEYLHIEIHPFLCRNLASP